VLRLGEDHYALMGHVYGDNGAVAIRHLHEDAHWIVDPRPKEGVNLNQMLLSSPNPCVWAGAGSVACFAVEVMTSSPGAYAVPTHFLCQIQPLKGKLGTFLDSRGCALR
jgi:hypothetical protein